MLARVLGRLAPCSFAFVLACSPASELLPPPPPIQPPPPQAEAPPALEDAGVAPPTVAAAPVADASAADARAEDAGTDAADDGDAATLPQGLAPEAIRQTVIKHRGAVQACYEAEARKNPKLKGSVRVRWVIEKSGKVTGQAIESSTLGNASVHGCLLHEVSTWTFPSSSARSSASFPFTFGHGP